MTRHYLPQRRYAETFSLRFWNQDFTVTVGLYADGRPGEVFISGAKSGMDVEGTVRDAAVLLSLSLQQGVPLDAIRHAVHGEPLSLLSAIVDKLLALRSAREGEVRA